MWLLVVVHSTQDHYKMQNQIFLKPEVVKYLSDGERHWGTFWKPMPLGDPCLGGQHPGHYKMKNQPLLEPELVKHHSGGESP